MTSSSPQRRGMTLIELMVSMAVGLLLLLLAAAMLRSSGEGYQHINGSIESDREARNSISQLTSDLSGASFHKDSIIETNPISRLGFLSLQPADAQSEARRIGDLCAIHYYVKDLTIGDKTVRCLMRGFRESADMFSALREGRVASLFEKRENQDEAAAFGVISFKVRPRSRGEYGLWIDWQNRSAVGPERLDVKLIFARRGLASRLKQSRDWDRIAELLEKDPTANARQDIEVYETPMRFGNHATP